MTVQFYVGFAEEAKAHDEILTANVPKSVTDYGKRIEHKRNSLMKTRIAAVTPYWRH